MPDPIRHQVQEDIGGSPEWLRIAEPELDAAHLFLEQRLAAVLPLLDRSGFIWVSWPKKASKAPTDITEDVIREVALPMTLVDVKVCSVDDQWSGLKLMIRKEYR